MAQRLFEKYGGVATVSKLVVEFYKKVLSDQSLVGYFKKTKMEKLMEHKTTPINFYL